MEKEGYTAEDFPNPRGEIHVYGNTIFASYWSNLPLTLDAIHLDGWYSTGIARKNFPNGSILLLELSR